MVLAEIHQVGVERVYRLSIHGEIGYERSPVLMRRLEADLIVGDGGWRHRPEMCQLRHEQVT